MITFRTARRSVYWQTCLFLLVLMASLARAATTPPDRRVLSGSIVTVADQMTASDIRQPRIVRSVLSATELDDSMRFEVALSMRNFPELQARIASGEQISREEMVTRYFPLPSDHDHVLAWLKDQSVEVTRTDDNRLGIFCRGKVATLARSLQMSFARVASDGGEFTSGISAPSLPEDIALHIAGIHGLQPHITPRLLGGSRLLTPRSSTAGSAGYLPAQIRAAYNADGLTQTGAGQVIAIFSLAFPFTSDLDRFWNQAGVSQTSANVQNVPVAGGPAKGANDGFSQEVTLDVEWAGALAPGAVIRIYGASADDPTSNDEIFQQIYADLPSQPGLHQLSVSIGFLEADLPKDYLVIESQYLAALASAGVSVLSASGDAGSFSNGVAQITTPTSDPCVTGVGGTSLSMNGSNVTTETVWSGSGGGVSAVFTRPIWQIGSGVPTGNMRLVPDVASAADPNTGAIVIYGNSQYVVGGTSWSAPTWAAWCALINQSRAAASLDPLGFLNPRLYPQAGTSAIRDIVQGSNGAYQAGVGYDMCTGIGVPNISALLNATQASSYAPIFASQLGDRTTVVGQPATFFVTAAGKAPLSYQWQRMPAGSSTWTTLPQDANYSGVTTAALVVSQTTQTMTGDQFQCIISNGRGSVTSAPAKLTVNTNGVTTFAGWPGSFGHVDATGWAARFNAPGSVRLDTAGNLWVVDSVGNVLRKVTPQGVVSTVVGTPGKSGTTDGPSSIALLNNPGGVAPDANGNVYIADSGSMTIRKLSPSGMVSTLAGSPGVGGTRDGTGSVALFFDPENLAVDVNGNIYVADGKGHTVRKITPEGVVTTLAGCGQAGSGDGVGVGASFGRPVGITVDGTGNVYVADAENNSIRMITPTGAVTTITGIFLAGNSDPSSKFNYPTGVAVDDVGTLYVTDKNNSVIRKIALIGSVRMIFVLAGSVGNSGFADGLATDALFAQPNDITIDSAGVLYISDNGNSIIRRLVPAPQKNPPVIKTQPKSQAVAPFKQFSLSVSASAAYPLKYIWLENNKYIPGGDKFTSYSDGDLTFINPTPDEAGKYSALVYGSGGYTLSDAADITITLPPPSSILPAEQKTIAGSILTLSASPLGSNLLSYYWTKDDTPLQDNDRISGSQSTTLIIYNTSSTDNGSYKLIASYNSWTSASQSFQVTTIPPLSTAVASIARQDPGPVFSGHSAVFRVTFNQGVTGVTADAFKCTSTGTASGVITSITPVSSSVYDVTVGSLSGRGMLRLDLLGNSSISGTPDPFTLGQEYFLSPIPIPLSWGDNPEGILGIGSALFTESSPGTTLTSGLLAGKSIAAFAVGGYHCLALTSEGLVYAWGSNSRGQLGNPNTYGTTQYKPVPVDTSGALQNKTIIAIAADRDYSLALANDGTVYSWGGNYSGQLGNGVRYDSSDKPYPIPVKMSGALRGKAIIAITTGSGRSLALASDGTVYDWGSGYLGNSVDITHAGYCEPTSIITNGPLLGKAIVQIGAGSGQSIALANDGTAYTWGTFYNSDSGFPQIINPIPTPVTLSTASTRIRFTAISAGYDNCLALSSDGYLYAWGENTDGQLGNNSYSRSDVPVPVNLNGALLGKSIVSIATGYKCSFAVTSEGNAFGWGGGAIGCGWSPSLSILSPEALDTSSQSALLGNALAGIYTNKFATNCFALAYSLSPIEIQPAGQTANLGSSVTLAVAASDPGASTYQWRKSGVPLSDGGNISGSSTAALTLNNVAASDAGNYTVIVTSRGVALESTVAALTVNIPPADPGRLTALSVRGFCGTSDQVLIPGYILKGSGTKHLVLRGIGPNLRKSNVTGYLTDPLLQAVLPNGTELMRNDNWSGDDGSYTGAAALDPGSKDAVISINQAEGVYCGILSGVGNSTGDSMVEVYDGDPSNTDIRITALSVRSQVTPGQYVIPGLIVSGSTSRKVIIRAVGPSMSLMGVANGLPDPKIEVYSAGNKILENDNWSGENGSSIGLLALPAGSKDAVLVADLQPGGYSILVSGNGNTGGIVLIEIYEMN